jgi:hypothetical protein
MSKADISTTPILSRRAALAGIAAGGAVAAAISNVALAAAPQTPDSELIELGARLEPLVDRYYAARKPWARSMVAEHAHVLISQPRGGTAG